MKNKIFPYVIAFSALAVSCSAAFYSVYGLGKLFAGASLQVMIMAGSLEFAKLVIASALYQYWSTINKALRAYLLIAVIVLITITSAGIYGYLSGAYQETYANTEIVTRQLDVLQSKKDNFQTQKTEYNTEKTQINESITQLRLAISNPEQSQYIDKSTGQVITNTKTTGKKLLQAELLTATAERDILDKKIQALSDSVLTTDMQIIELRNSDTSVRELGPLMYLSKLTGISMDQVINWYLLLIIFVFDPLAITLVVIANQAFNNSGKLKNDERDIKVDNNQVESLDIDDIDNEYLEKTYYAETSNMSEPVNIEIITQPVDAQLEITGSTEIQIEDTIASAHQEHKKQKQETSKRVAYWAR